MKWTNFTWAFVKCVFRSFIPIQLSICACYFSCFFTLYYFVWTFSCSYIIHIMSLKFLLDCHPYCCLPFCFCNLLLSITWMLLFNLGLCVCMRGRSLGYTPQNKITVSKSLNTFIVLVVYGNYIFCIVFIV